MPAKLNSYNIQDNPKDKPQRDELSVFANVADNSIQERLIGKNTKSNKWFKKLSPIYMTN